MTPNSVTISLLALALVPLCLSVEDCGSTMAATAGDMHKWPVANPALVAPVTTSYQYELYTAPLHAELTSTSIAVKIPPNFGGNFSVIDAKGKATEQYVLMAMEIRRPGMMEGSTQVLPHALEVVLVHKEITGTGYWASVVMPVDVSTTPTVDPLSVLFAGSSPPMEWGEINPVLLSGTLALDLNSVWKDAAFYSFWGKLPTTCSNYNVNARYLLRNATISTSAGTYHDIAKALESTEARLPLEPPKQAFLLHGCPQGISCKPMGAEDLSTSLLEAQQIQSRAVSQLRKQKRLMDKALADLQNGSSEAYQDAVAARSNLLAASSELDSIAATVTRLSEQKAVAEEAVWDADKPQANNTLDVETDTQFAHGNSSTGREGAAFLAWPALEYPAAIQPHLQLSQQPPQTALRSQQQRGSVATWRLRI